MNRYLLKSILLMSLIQLAACQKNQGSKHVVKSPLQRNQQFQMQSANGPDFRYYANSSYRFRNNLCDTGLKQFSSIEDTCQHLKDDKFNNNCMIQERQLAYTSLCTSMNYVDLSYSCSATQTSVNRKFWNLRNSASTIATFSSVGGAQTQYLIGRGLLSSKKHGQFKMY